MNTENTIVTARNISLQKPYDVVGSHKSELKIDKQPGPSVSTIDTIPITTPKSNAIKNSTKTALDRIVVVAMESVKETLERKVAVTKIINEQHKIKSEQLNIKAACEALLNDLNGVASADQKIICTLNSILKFYRQIGVDEDTNIEITELESSLDKISRTCCLLNFADDYIVDKVKRINGSIELCIEGKIELKNLVIKIKSFVDTMIWKLSNYRIQIARIKYPEMFDVLQTGTF